MGGQASESCLVEYRAASPLQTSLEAIPALPTEVMERVFVWAKVELEQSDGLSVLSACSLVCRAWLPRCSKHLLKFIDFTRGRFTLEVLDSLLSLMNNSTRLQRHVYTLLLPCHPEERRFRAVLDAAPNLSALSFFAPKSRVDEEEPPDELPVELETKVLQRRELERFTLSQQIGTTSLRSLYFFSRIDKLSLLNFIYAEDTEYTLPSRTRPHLAVKELMLDAANFSLLEPLRRLIVPGTLVSVCVTDMCRGDDTRDYAQLHRFLRKVGVSVEHLELGIPSQSSSSRWAGRIDLHRGFTLGMCPKLRELEIKCRSWQHNLPRACNIFLAALPPSIRRIRLELDIHPARDGSHRLKYDNTALVPIWQLVDRATAAYDELEEVEIAAPFVPDPPPLGLLAGCSAQFGQMLKISRLLD